MAVAIDSFFRSVVLTVAGNRTVSELFQKYGMRIGVSRFVAAERPEEAVNVVKQLNEQGLSVTLDYLGESVSDRALAIEAANEAIAMLRRIDENGLHSNVSVKLTQLGLNISPSFCEEQMVRILETAEKTNNFVRIDMEDSSVTQLTIDLFVKLIERFGPSRVGLVLQSYLVRSEKDRLQLGRLGAKLRIVKGAYKEPKEIAYPDKRDVDANFVSLVKQHLAEGLYTAIATHDERIIGELVHYCAEQRIARDRFEFQMLYGIATTLQHRLVKDGYNVRVYTPYGEFWYPYFTRRIAERPANLWFVLRGMIRT